MQKYAFTTFVDLVGTKSSHLIKGRVNRPLWPWQDYCFTAKLWSNMLEHLINFGLVPRLKSNWEQGYCIATTWFCDNWSLPCTNMAARHSSSSGDQPNQPLTFSFPKRIFGKKHPVYCFISAILVQEVLPGYTVITKITKCSILPIWKPQKWAITSISFCHA